MRDLSASIESPPVSPSRGFLLPDADSLLAAWADPPPEGGLRDRPDEARTVCAVMLALGAALLLLVPVGGVFFLIAGGLGLAIAAEATTTPTAPTAPKNGAPSGC